MVFFLPTENYHHHPVSSFVLSLIKNLFLSKPFLFLYVCDVWDLHSTAHNELHQLDRSRLSSSICSLHHPLNLTVFCTSVSGAHGDEHQRPAVYGAQNRNTAFLKTLPSLSTVHYCNCPLNLSEPTTPECVCETYI